SLPLAQFWQELLECLLVSDEVVVNKINVPAIARSIDGVEFRQHLLRRLGARNSTKQLDDVAELAVEGAAARELHRHEQVVCGIEQVETRNGACADIDLEVASVEHALACAAGNRGDELVNDALGLAEDPEVRSLKHVGAGCYGRPADNDALAE